MSPRRVRVIGAGRAGGSLARALEAAGWELEPPLGRDDDLTGAAEDVDLLVIATPDGAIAEVASKVRPDPGAVVVHLSGVHGLDVLEGHPRVGAIHPLVSLPTPEVGAGRLRDGAFFAVAGDPFTVEVVEALGGTHFEVADEDRATYHAAACIASNHLVALMGQVERVAADVGVPPEAYLALAAASLRNVEAIGAAAALTGPAARGDDETIEAHVAALDPSEREAYLAMVELARRLAGR